MARQYLKYARIGTVIWLTMVPIYFALKPHLFIQMFPFELGEFITGWFAPLAAVWVGAAVVLQREQLVAQRRELHHAIVESRRSIAELQRKSADAHLDRLVGRLAFGIQRLARTSEKCNLRKRGENAVAMSDIVGRYSVYSELVRSKEIMRLFEECGAGVDAFVERIEKDGWVIHASEELIEDLLVEMGALHRLCLEIEKAADTGGSITDAAAQAELPRFKERMRRGHDYVAQIRHEYDALGV